MKVRNGFVSNSSSSSFIMYGAKLKTNDKLQEAYWEKSPDNIDCDFGDDDDGNDSMWIGKTLATGLEDECPTKIDIPTPAEMEKIKADVIEYCSIYKVKVPEKSFGIYAGNIPN